MFPKEIELILARQLSSYLATPVFIVDRQGTLIFYNESAEAILGRRYDETGEMPLDEWTMMFEPRTDTGAPLRPDTLPLVIALQDCKPAHGNFWIRGVDNALRHIEVTAFPVIGQSDRFLGAIAIFWEVNQR